MEHAPWKLIRHGNGDIIVDINGGITADNQRYCPFPSPITHMVLTNQGLLGTWVDHDLRIARMALLSVDKLTNGIEKGELRRNKSSTKVAGSSWSHNLDAEPLAIDSDGERICFALWTRGIYCIKDDATELWRSPIVPSDKLPRSQEIAALHIKDEILHVWTRGAKHLTMAMSDGEYLSENQLPIEADIEKVFSDGDEFLLSSRDGWSWLVSNGDVKIAHQLRGTIQHAVKDENGKWRIISWRDDLILGEEKYTKRDLGVQIVNKDNTWQVLDNLGNYSPHMGE